MSHGLVFPEPGSATVWHESDSSAEPSKVHLASSSPASCDILLMWGLVWLDPVLKQKEKLQYSG